jgi:hypothetical protein
MKVHVVYDNEGNIISASVPLPPAYDFRGPRFGPIARQGNHAAELEVPEEHATLGFVELAQRLRVDVKAKQDRLALKAE